jgi:signal transduction histidine kinase
MADRILVVEDSPTQAEALRVLLVDAGYEVVTARSGESALERLEGFAPFDVILSDIVMPGMSGYDLCRVVKARDGGESPPVILLTTLSDARDIVRGLECGADNYVTKPYTPQQLLQRIRQVLGNRVLRRSSSARGAANVQFMGETFSISAEKEQILDMLLSSFEELVHTTEALRRSKSELAILHSRAEDRAERLTRLQAITEALSRAGTSAEVLHVVLTTARDVLGADTAIAVLMADAGSQELVESVGHAPESIERWARVLRQLGRPGSNGTAAGIDGIVSSRQELLAAFPASDAPSHPALLAAPLDAGGRTLGAWAITYARSRRFEEIDRQFFGTLSRVCAQALDRARLYELERRARADAEEANRAKAQFLASMSHDLRTPLNAIGGYVQLIELGIRGPVTPEQLVDLGRIQRSQQFLLSLINDVLNFAKLEAGSVVYDISPFPIRGLLADVELMVRPQMDSRGLLYSWSAPGPEVEIAVDPEKLQQVLLNLVGNALKFTPTGGTISISCRLAEHTVDLLVQDTGIGIPPEKLESIFDPFVQVHPDAEHTREGIGLGLSISRNLVRGMGGELSVASEVGRGSLFTLTIPRANGPPA